MSKPFENIAISLSGGGYRAAAFHLGALSYLDSVPYDGIPLLQKVKVVSTISGGTFTGVGYVLALAQGKAFKDAFYKLYRLLEEDKLVVEALQMINNTPHWKAQEKNKNLINAFSEVYQARFCDDTHLSLLLQSPLGHLDEFCFNATDMYDTLPYRFQKKGKIGNGDMDIDEAAAAEIRLGDVMAASSCFPGGFEPMAFPQDFIREKNSPLERFWMEKKYPKDIALMDGGILDNQGIESVQLANRRRPDDQKIGTYIISDVSPREAAPFEFPAVQPTGFLGNLTYRNITLILAIFTFLGVAGAWWFWNSSKIMLIVSVLALVFGGLALAALLWLHKFIEQMVAGTVDQKSETPAILKNLDILEKTPVHILKRLASIRFFSLSDIMENTFMSRIRSLQISELYNEAEWEHKLVSNNIYSLYTNWKRAKNIPPPTEQMLKTAEQAAAMPTALWFTTKEKKEGMLDALIIAGQMNLCFQLLLHIDEELNDPNVIVTFPPETQATLKTLEERIRADYHKFMENEKWLLSQINSAS